MGDVVGVRNREEAKLGWTDAHLRILDLDFELGDLCFGIVGDALDFGIELSGVGDLNNLVDDVEKKTGDESEASCVVVDDDEDENGKRQEVENTEDCVGEVAEQS